MKLNIYITLETICSIKLCWEILIEVALFYLESRNAIEEIFFFFSKSCLPGIILMLCLKILIYVQSLTSKFYVATFSTEKLD